MFCSFTRISNIRITVPTFMSRDVPIEAGVGSCVFNASAYDPANYICEITAILMYCIPLIETCRKW
jgi:hypothetical protein